MAGELKIRYEWGTRFSSSGQYVNAFRGTMLCARFKMWHRSVESNSVILYPDELRRPGYIKFGMKTVPKREIYDP